MMPVRRTNWFPGIFNDFFGNEWIERQRSAAPAVNIIENDKAYNVEIVAPGLTKNDFNINVHDNDTLTISAEKKVGKNDEHKANKYLRREFSYSSFRQTMILPDDVEKENIKAKMEDGVLYIDIPKVVKEEKPYTSKRIEIV
jgi:HSP20 family protein